MTLSFMLLILKQANRVYIYIYIYIYTHTQKSRDLFTNINRSDYSHSLEKLHPGTAGNDEVLLRPGPAVTATKRE